MNKLTTKIVADSSSDILKFQGVSFASAPLKISTSEKHYIDDSTLNVEEMVNDLASYSGKSSTSCPNTEDWLAAFGDAEEVFCITITAALSGSYNAARIAKSTYEDEHPGRRVHVINSLSTGPEMKIIIEKLAEYIEEEIPFDEAVERITKYTESTGLVFMLQSMKNLVNNGRVNPLVAKVAGFLGINVVGKASDKGELQQLAKCRGERKAISEMHTQLELHGYSGGKLRIANCLNENAARELAASVRAKYPDADIEIYPCRGLCSFYAERGGMLVGFEKET